MPDKPKVSAITFGSAMVDTIAVLQSDSVEKISLSNAHSQFLLVEPGRKIEAEEITTHIGGGALNTAVCLARLGCEVMPVVKTGKDPSLDLVEAHCKKNQLNVDGMIISHNDPTGAAVMIASHEKNAAIFTQRGANTKLVKEDLVALRSVSVDLVHAAGLSGESANMLPEIASLAKKTGAFFSSNPGIRQISNKSNSVLTAAQDMALISLNAVEATALIPCLSALDRSLDWGTPKRNEPSLSSPGGRVPLEKFCQALASHGPKNVLVTFGGEGAWLFDGKDLHHQDVIAANVAGTAGAGDAFVATLAWGLNCGRPASHALLLAAHNASSVVSHVDTTTGLLKFEALQERANLIED